MAVCTIGNIPKNEKPTPVQGKFAPVWGFFEY